MFSYCENNPVNKADYSGNLPQWIKNAWSVVKTWFNNTFGVGSTIESSNTYSDEIIPEPSFIVVESGTTLTKVISETGDSSKPFSGYTIIDSGHPIKSSKAGIKINVFDLSVDACIGLDDTSISVVYSADGKSHSLSAKVNIAQLRIGAEYSNSVEVANTITSKYVNCSASGTGIFALVVYALNGQHVMIPQN